MAVSSAICDIVTDSSPLLGHQHRLFEAMSHASDHSVEPQRL
jgi:hypothetical protein